MEARQLFTVTASAALQVGEATLESTLPRRSAAVGDSLYFAREVYQRGTDELWRTDGTPGGTEEVTPFIGDQYAHASHFTNLNGTLYFIASGDAYGVGLWKSDGTRAGTEVVRKFASTLPTTVAGLELIASDDELYLSVSSAFGGDGGTWRSDGTTAGTVRLTPTVGDDLTLSGGSLYFLDGGVSTGGLWRSNGTVATTAALNTFAESDLAATADGTLYFTGTQAGAVGLYRTDGTAPGTLLKPFPAGNSFAAPITLTAVGNAVFFEISDPAVGTELWRSDGTTTAVVKDIRPGVSSSSPASFTAVGDTLYFVAADAVNGRELWKSDGTADGTALVKDAVPGTLGPIFANFTVVGDALYYSAADAATGRELWLSDGTDAGTARLHDLYPGAGGSAPRELVPFNDALLYQATDPVGGYGLFRQPVSGGTAAANPTLVNDFVDGPMSPNLAHVATPDGRFYFVGGDGSTLGRELFATDGSTGAVSLVKDLFPGAIDSAPQSLTAVGNTVFFSAEGQNTGRELFKSDGTSGGTVLVRNLFPSMSSSDSNDGDPRGLINYNGTLFFSGFESNTGGYRLWKSNGTTAGTVVMTRSDGSKVVGTSELALHNGLLYFEGASGLWRTDGTPSGTYPTAGSSTVSGLTSAGGALYFGGSAGSLDGEEPWRSDGVSTAIRLRDINPSTSDPFRGSSRPTSFTGFNKHAFFVAYDPAVGRELWRTDGTEAGTVLVKDVRLPANEATSIGVMGSDPSGLASVNGRMMFFADDGIHGRELWVSNGTADGTAMLKDINAGSASSGGGMVVIGRRAYFTANDGGSGEELWTTDGTADGTFRVADINPGAGSASPRNLTVMNGVLTFTANDGSSGVRLYTAELPDPDPAPDPAPTVTDVFVGSSTWVPAFGNFLASSGQGEAAFGYRISAANHTNELPWTSINRISVRFSEDIATPAAAALALRGVNTPLYTGMTVAYDQATRTATWSLPTPMRADRLLLDLDDAGIADIAGNALDGEWANPTTPTGASADSFPSGDGTAGGDFRFRLNVLPGDVNGTGSILGSDVTLVRNAQGSEPGFGLYTIFKDVNGTGSILGSDVTLVRNRQGISLPDAEPVAPAAAAWDVQATAAATKTAVAAKTPAAPLFATGTSSRSAMRLLAQQFDLLGDELAQPLIA